MEWTWVVTLIATVVIPMVTLAVSQLGLRHKAEVSYVSRLERRVANTERELDECLQDRTDLRRRIEALERKRS